jgi:F420-dependent oxidoreductase-like protein
VFEGWHGVAYYDPLQGTRAIVDICRQVWRRDRLDHAGKKYTIPLPAEQGTGLGKPLKLINTPVRERIPVMLAALGPKNVELAAEIAEAWEPIFFVPEKAASVWGDSLAAGKARRDPALGNLQVVTGVPVAIGEDVEPLLDFVRPALALYIGGMGARGKNFYNDLAVRYGYEAEAKTIQDLYLDGRKDEAAAAVPDELVRSSSLIGPESYVAERIAAFAEAGVTTLMLQPLDDSREARLRTVETMRRLAG